MRDDLCIEDVMSVFSSDIEMTTIPIVAAVGPPKLVGAISRRTLMHLW